jgi:hypothetical protein
MSLLGGRPRGFALWIIFVIIGAVGCLSHSVPTSAPIAVAKPPTAQPEPQTMGNGDALSTERL